MMSQNGLFDHAQYSTNPKNEEFETITREKYRRKSLNSLSSIVYLRDIGNIPCKFLKR